MEKLRDLLFALIIFSGIIIGMSNFYAELFSNYGSSVQDISDLEVTQAVNTHVSTLKSSIEDTQVTGIALIDIPLTIASGSYNTLKLMFTSMDIYQGMLSDFASIGVPIPSWTIQIIEAAIGVFVVFEIISAVTKYKV